VPLSFDLLINCELHDLESSMVVFIAEGRNFDEFKSGGLHEKHALASWNLGILATFA
jgi:hypothetical protein